MKIKSVLFHVEYIMIAILSSSLHHGRREKNDAHNS